MSGDLVTLFVCIAVALAGVVAAAVAWRRHRPGRVAQAGAVVLLPIALFCLGLLPLMVRGVTAIGTWATSLALSALVWVGIVLLAITIVLWVVGGYVARRGRVAAPATPPAAGRGRPAPAVGTGASEARGAAPAGQPAAARPGGRGGKAAEPVDEDMAEIEALLKARGIE